MKLVILDRDGTINHDSDQYIKSPSEWKPIPGSLEAIARLTQGGWRCVVATNQSGIARGLFDTRALARAAIDAGRVRADGRAVAKPSEQVAEDALLLDNTALSIQASVDQVLDWWNRRLGD